MDRRILFVDQCAELGGGELSLLDVARAWRTHSEVVLFEDGPFRSLLQKEGVPVTVESMSGSMKRITRDDGFWASFLSIPRVLRLAWRLAGRARAFDLIYANSQKAMVVAALAGVIACRPVIWHLRDILSSQHLSASHRRTAVLLANLFVARVLCNSQATYDAFVDSGGHAERATIVYNGLDPAEYATAEESGKLRAELGIQKATPLIGVFSRLAAWKGQDVLLRALPSIPRAHAIVVGEALFEGDEAYADSLRDLAIRLDVEDRVHFLGFRNDVPTLMNEVDVVCHTSTAPEPFGRVIVEGMLSGRPVVATAAGGALEIIDDGVTGCLVPPGDADALATCINEIFQSPDTAQRMTDKARLKAQRHFSLESMLHGVDQTFASLLSPTPNAND